MPKQYQKWDEHDVQIIMEAVAKQKSLNSRINWNIIMTLVKNKTRRQCYDMWLTRAEKKKFKINEEFHPENEAVSPVPFLLSLSF